MTGDISRDTFSPGRHYSAVLMQQGRVQLDADWNEQRAIDRHRVETETRDLIGPTGGQAGNAGFEIGVHNKITLSIGRGNLYVDGILCQNDLQGDGPLLFEAQEDRPGNSPLNELRGDPQVGLVYLDVWERHVTALDDDHIREVALGGPDTTTRSRTIWQAKLLPVEADTTNLGTLQPLLEDHLDKASKLEATETVERLKLTEGTNASHRQATLSAQHTEDPQIPADPEVEVSIGTTTATAELDFSSLGIQLPARIPLAQIAPVLQAAIRLAGPDNPAFSGLEVHSLANRLVVLSAQDATEPVVFANTQATQTADRLKLTEGANASHRQATLSAQHTEDPQIPADPELEVSIGTTTATAELDFSDPRFTLPGRVSLQEVAPILQSAILAADEAFGGVEVHSLANKLVVFSAEIPGYLRITFTPGLTRSLDTRTAVLYGNVALATHGETESREILGSGDASTAYQSFQIRKSPVTFAPSADAPGGVASTLQVKVGGVLWDRVNTLYGRGGEDQVYTAHVDDEGEMTIRFGDGAAGRRLPSGRDNVVASYRQGLGKSGEVRANSLTTLLDRPVGLKSVTNPAKAQGGADPETFREARTNAPNTVRTLERIVSLRDFEDATREFAGVAKARAQWTWDVGDQIVLLTVAGDDGAEVDGVLHKNLVKYLNSRRDPNRGLVVTSYHKVPVQIEASIVVCSDRVPEEIQAAAQQTLKDYFSFDNLELGQPIHLSDVYRTLQDVTGVAGVFVDRLSVKGSTDDKDKPPAPAVQGHLRIEPTHLACLENPATDAVVRVKAEQER
jgi:predicted phage baseplate assembly protein